MALYGGCCFLGWIVFVALVLSFSQATGIQSWWFLFLVVELVEFFTLVCGLWILAGCAKIDGYFHLGRFLGGLFWGLCVIWFGMPIYFGMPFFPNFGIPHRFDMPMVFLVVGLGTGSVDRPISACRDSELFGRPNSFGLPNMPLVRTRLLVRSTDLVRSAELDPEPNLRCIFFG